MLTSTRVWQTIGKTILPSSCSQLKEVSNLNQSSMFQRELHSICLRLKRRKITLSCMSEEFSLWMTAINSFLNIWDSLEVLLIQKICHLTSQESISNITKSWRLLRKTLLRNVSNSSNKFLRMLKILRNSMNNLVKTLN